MKERFTNTLHLEGLLYDHSLTLKQTGPGTKAPGTDFISGVVKVAVDPEMTNIVEVHYTYVVEKTAKGKTNDTFVNLKAIIGGIRHTYMDMIGKEEYVPAYVRIDTSIALNDYYNGPADNRELVSAKRNEGGFLHFIKESELNPEIPSRNAFKADMIITSINRLEADPERDIPERMNVQGAIFDFRRAVLPVNFTLYNPHGMELFEGQAPSSAEPFCTEVRGKVVSTTVLVKTEDESAFGPDLTKETPRSRKEYVIESIFKQVSYPWDDASFITAEELKKAIAEREIYLATVKERQEEYEARRNNATKTIESKPQDFKF